MHRRRGLRSPRVAQDMQTIGGVVGQWCEVRVGYLEDVDLHRPQWGLDLHAGGPAEGRPRGEE